MAKTDKPKRVRHPKGGAFCFINERQLPSGLYQAFRVRADKKKIVVYRDGEEIPVRGKFRDFWLGLV